MLVLRSLRVVLLAGSALATPALAQTPAAPSDSAVAPAPVAKPVTGKRIYVAADFTRFAPKTAYDMLTQVPIFKIGGRYERNWAAISRSPNQSVRH